MLEDQDRYLNGFKSLWIEQKNPVWVWSAIKTSIRNHHSFPNWVCNYLEQCADQVLSPEASTHDFARKLPRMLGFTPTRGPKHQLKIGERMVRNERFAMKFAEHILNGKKPSDARGAAANECRGRWQKADDKTLQAALREHFKLKRAPVSKLVWQRIVIKWLVNNPLYFHKYPDLPPLNALFQKLAAIPRDSSVTQK